MDEEKIDKEIMKALLKNEVYQNYFNFRVYLPVHPSMKERLLTDTYKKRPELLWTKELQRKDIAEVTEINQILNLFKEAQFKKSDAYAEIKHKTDNFEQNWNFVNSCVFEDNHDCRSVEFKGHLWVKELFMISQLVTPSINVPMTLILTMIMSMVWITTEMVSNMRKMRLAEEMNMKIDMSTMPTRNQ